MSATIVPATQHQNRDETVSRIDLIDRLDNLERAMDEFSSTLEQTERFCLFRYIHQDFESLKRDVNNYISKA